MDAKERLLSIIRQDHRVSDDCFNAIFDGAMAIFDGKHTNADLLKATAKYQYAHATPSAIPQGKHHL